MATTADIKNGLCIEFNNDIYSIVEFLHVKPGKGNTFVRTKIRNLRTGKVLDNTFPAGHKIEVVRVENRPYQFLYQDDTGLQFMHTETFEQITIPAVMVSNADLMKEGQVVQVLFHTESESPLTCELPPFVILQVTYAEPGIKGDTATRTLKPATVETGAKVQVPLFIEEGEVIKVDTRTYQYVERVK